MVSEGFLISFFGLISIFFIDYFIFSYPMELYFFVTSFMHSSISLMKDFLISCSYFYVFSSLNRIGNRLLCSSVIVTIMVLKKSNWTQVSSKNFAKLLTFFWSYFKLLTKYFIFDVRILTISMVFSMSRVNLILGGLIDFSGMFSF